MSEVPGMVYLPCGDHAGPADFFAARSAEHLQVMGAAALAGTRFRRAAVEQKDQVLMCKESWLRNKETAALYPPIDLCWCHHEETTDADPGLCETWMSCGRRCRPTHKSVQGVVFGLGLEGSSDWDCFAWVWAWGDEAFLHVLSLGSQQ